MENKQYTLKLGDQEIIFEVGKLAQQCNGSAICRAGDTMVMATCTLSKEARAGVNFLPLMVNYQEKYYAAGVIGGVKFQRREARPPNDKIIMGRLIDRGLRPSLPKDLRKDIQVMLSVLCYDSEHSHDMVAANAASLAVSISDCPLDGPLGTVRVGMVNGELILNPSEEVRKKMEMDLVITANDKNIIMLEGDGHEIPEDKFLEAILFGKKWAQKIVQFIRSIQDEIGREKFEVEPITYDEKVQKFVEDNYRDHIKDAIFNISGKLDRYQRLHELKKEAKEKVEKEFDEELANDVSPIIDKFLHKEVRKGILDEEKRIAGRKLDEIRPLTCEVDLLPRAHGSSLFQRGETQGLNITTLGGPSAKLWIENMEGSDKRRYFHHYNFPPYSVGETSNRLFTGNREIGHGNLAERAIIPVLPSEEDFPYTIRTVTEILQSNGSSSMAATCSSSLSLMAAGVPIKTHVAGIAMGLMSDKEKGTYTILMDLQDEEDFGGDMDFKITGTKDGITAIQIDTKIKGLPDEVFKEALEKAKKGRLIILEEMNRVISEPRKELSQYAPRLYTIKIDPSQIRDVIGKGGETINKIIAETGVEIDIQEDGTVIITSADAAMAQKALDWINKITEKPKVGKTYEGKVVRIAEFGAFVEILPGQDGLVHISMLAPERVNRVEDIVKMGDIINVKVMEIDSQGRVRLSLKDARQQSAPAERAPKKAA